MLGKAQNSESYKKLIGPQETPTAWEIWNHMAWCPQCCTLWIGKPGYNLVLSVCHDCGNDKKICRPPAYQRMKLEQWCTRRAARRGLSPVYKLAVLVSRKDALNGSRIIVPAHLRKPSPPKEVPRARRPQLGRMIDLEQIKRQFPGKVEELGSVDEIIEEAKDRTAFRKRKEIERPHKIRDTVRRERELEPPNVERKGSVINPFDWKPKDN